MHVGLQGGCGRLVVQDTANLTGGVRSGRPMGGERVASTHNT
jgi:hypothetical protein